MSVVLEVISYKGGQPDSPLSARFDENGGTIGRSADNHLVLADESKIISRRHGAIRYENGAYIFADTSTGGTLLCNENRLLENGESVALAAGDRLRIGEYELRVLIEAEVQPISGLFSGMDTSMSFGDHAAGSPLDISLPPLFGDREPPPAFAQPAPLSHGLKDSFINQPDVPPFQGNFALPEIQPISEGLAFDALLQETPALPPAAPAKADDFEFPDDWFGDLGREANADAQPRQTPPSPALPVTPPPSLGMSISAPQPGTSDLTGSASLELDAGMDAISPSAKEQSKAVADPFSDGPILIEPHFSAEVTPSVAQTGFDAAVGGGNEPVAETPASMPSIDIPKPGRSIPASRAANPIAVSPAEPVQPVVQAHPVPLPTETVGGADLFQAFLDGARLAEFPALTAHEQMRAMKSLGEVYREMIEGMMMVLRARTEEKREIRTDITVIRKEKNNPLKFIPTAEDAMKVMISGKFAGYIDATVAVREGFSDMMKHQMAMRAGMQAAVSEVLRRFEPSGFEKRFEEGIVFQKKAKCWDAYNKAYPKLLTEAMENLFGETFVKAYEEQLRILREQRDKG